MKKVTNENVIPLFAQEQIKPEETWRKSIPAQVFLNYFFAINYHIQHTDDNSLENLTFFREHHANLDEKDLEAVGKILLTSWSTEYALRATAELGSEDYLRHALHWTFPQAYYTIFAGLQAFLYTLNIKTNSAELISREVGRLVVRNAYPRAVGYYAAGPYPDFTMHRLPLAGYKPTLQIPEKGIDAQAQIGQFLRTTRKLRAQTIRNQVQNNSQTALRSPKTGKVLEKWNTQHWSQITWRMGYTTLFDLLSRLRISSSHKEIDRFVEADIDFKLFHESLLDIVSYLNGIHESYVAQAIGLEKYQRIVEELPVHLHNSFVTARLQDTIEPIFGEGKSYQLSTAA
ncbi:hypothetical protein [Adhaeribacter rhizoryzae]|uniref:Uncharacterized protein n=1 Tax=Adhaeribacter rhizoryzae TaxID=2607907 RepID=A0A5M6DMN0_9BACT|nr:hypothetical protein [Adhaeribacter rhizoryzae]KAA5546655.1 hypothetical protein F0145_09920 [Adhaeribacter rhizoryzae]